jgi:hypothetical protein
MKPYRVQPDKCVISSAIMMRETRATTRVRKQPRIARAAEGETCQGHREPA